MNYRKILFSVSSVAFIAFAALLGKTLITRQVSSTAAIRIDAVPKSNIFLNDKGFGTTPFYNEKIEAGQYKIKVGTWEMKIKLLPNTLTYVNRSFGQTDEQSSGQVLTLEKLSTDKSGELAVVSTPDAAKVIVDGLEKGLAPLIVRDIGTGDREIVVSQNGYSDQIIRGRIIAGYRLDVVVQLAKLINRDSSNSIRQAADLIGSPSGQITKPYVVIKDTPVGFLRVRIEPTVTASEVGQIKPGEKYMLLSEVDGWVKIKLANLFGWVSDQYVEKVK